MKLQLSSLLKYLAKIPYKKIYCAIFTDYLRLTQISADRQTSGELPVQIQNRFLQKKSLLPILCDNLFRPVLISVQKTYTNGDIPDWELCTDQLRLVPTAKLERN